MIIYQVVWLHLDNSRVDSLAWNWNTVHNGAVYLRSFTIKPVDVEEVVGMLFGVVELDFLYPSFN
jgi:hypothetical protein